MARTRRTQPSLALVAVLALTLALLFAWSTRRTPSLGEGLQAAAPPTPIAVELPHAQEAESLAREPAPPLPRTATAGPLAEVLAPIVADPDWCSDRIADAMDSVPQDDSVTHAPYFYVLSDTPGTDTLPLKSTRAEVDIAGTVAEVALAQTYRNDGEVPLEAIYLFPASTGAAVHAMTLTVGDRVIEAQIRETEEAREEYETAKEQGKTASLLVQHRPNVLQMMVANILPGDEVRVELVYAEPLVPVDGQYEFVLPTVVGPRYPGGAAPSDDWLAAPYLHEGEPALHTFGIEVAVRTPVPLGEVAVPSHAVRIERPGAREARLRVEDSATAGNRDFVLRFGLAGDAVQSGLLLYPGTDESFFALTVAPPQRVPLVQVMPREVIFVVDVSGSMSGFPLDVSKELMADLLGELQPHDHLNVLLFAGGSAVLAEASLPATAENVSLATAFVDAQAGGGGTELLPALERAMALPRVEGASRTVVVATDGYVAVEKEAFDLVDAHLGEANLFTFGIGTSVNRFLVEGLARAGGGEPVVALHEGEARERARGFRDQISAPVLANVRVEFDGFEAYDLATDAVGDLFAGRPVTVVGKYRGEASGRVVVRGDTAGGRFETVVDASRGKLSTHNRALRTLWARKRVETLADHQVLAPDDARVAEVTRLGLTYGLLTEHTSFVAVDRSVRTHGAPVRVDQPQPMPRGVPNTAIGACSALGADGELFGSQYGAGGFGSAGSGLGGGGVAFFKGGGGGGGSGNGASGYGSGGGYFGAKGSGTIRVSSGDPIVLGALDRDAIERVVRGHLAQIRYCYQRELQKDWDLEGRIVFRFVIGRDGSVVSAEVIESDLANQVLESCVNERLMRLKFPAPDGGGIVVVSYPFVFSSVEDG